MNIRKIALSRYIKKKKNTPNKRKTDQSKVDSFELLRNSFKYSLPTVVVSYPRSGSNFLQSVLASSSGLPIRSFHSPKENMKELSHYGLKSHALSSEWLADEFSRTTVNYKYPEKIIYIHRDPRDVMISFYEYVQHVKGIKLQQAGFLDKVSYVYATYNDTIPVLGRTNSIEPMSVLDGYKAHYKNWMLREASESYHIIKYEDLVLTPEVAFQGIFDFLELECHLSVDSLGRRVSQYDNKSRKRGGVYGWKNNEEEYHEIIRSVENHLSDEIKHLNY
jgi:hypothetical protein